MTRDELFALVPDCKSVNRYMLLADGTIGLVFGIASDCILLHPMRFEDGIAILGRMVSYSFDTFVSVIERNEIVSDANGIAIHHAIVKTDFETVLDFTTKINELYDNDIRNNACNELIDALLASCENQEERTSLAIALLGYDPRDNEQTTISDFNL